mgnify:CR=1 FL=1
MREISAVLIEEAVEKLFLEANGKLSDSLENKIRSCEDCETNPIAKGIFADMCKNLDAAKELNIPICQDTGMAVLFCELGQDVHIVDGDWGAGGFKGFAHTDRQASSHYGIASDGTIVQMVSEANTAWTNGGSNSVPLQNPVGSGTVGYNTNSVTIDLLPRKSLLSR